MFFGILVKVTKVATKSYQGYYWTPKNAKNGPKKHNKLFFCPKGKKCLGRSPPQELDVSPRSGLYLLVFLTRAGLGVVSDFLGDAVVQPQLVEPRVPKERWSAGSQSS